VAELDGGRRPLVAGNWKMNLTHLEAINVVQKLYYCLQEGGLPPAEVSIHPSFTSLRSVQTVIESDDMPIALGAQDVHWEPKGPFTGEVSASMLAKLNVRYVIVGHSERRQHFGETDDTVNAKAKAVLAAGMIPMVCVGESAAQRDAGEGEEVVLGQLRASLSGLSAQALASSVVAYEPVWAIGTGRNATGDDAQAMAAAIRAALEAEFGSVAARATRVLYGGSVIPDNVAELVAGPDVDGVLVGGASLDPVVFARIARLGRTT